MRGKRRDEEKRQENGGEARQDVLLAIHVRRSHCDGQY
jgi:hypothetical protein